MRFLPRLSHISGDAQSPIEQRLLTDSNALLYVLEVRLTRHCLFVLVS